MTATQEQTTLRGSAGFCTPLRTGPPKRVTSLGISLYRRGLSALQGDSRRRSMRHRRLLTVAITLATGAILAVPAVSASADQPGTSFRQTNLVTDDQARAQARFTDTSLTRPSGIGWCQR